MVWRGASRACTGCSKKTGCWCLVGKADLLSDHFDRKLYREAVDLSLNCHPSPSFTTFAFRSSDVRRLLLDLDPYGRTDPLGLFPLFLRRALLLVYCFGCLFVCVVSRRAGDRTMSPQFKRSTVLFCCQLPTDFHHISIV